MSNTSTIKVVLKIDKKGVVRGFQEVGSESTKAGKKGRESFNLIDRSVQGATRSIQKMGAAAIAAIATGFAVAEMVEYTKAVVEAGVALDSLNRSYEAIMGSAALAGKEMSFVNETAKQLGLNLPVLEKSYQGILAAAKGTELAGEKVRRVFTAVSQASAVLGLSADDTQGTLRALSQMISKGNVQAEELRGQLGERLPGAFQMAAEAMGVTTQQLNKMLEQGEVLASDLLPKLADVLTNRYGAAAEKAGDSSRAAFENLNTEMLEFKRNLAESGIVEYFANMARKMTNVMDAANKMFDSVDK